MTKAIHPGEPSFDDVLLVEKIDLIRALNFYSMHASDDNVREWIRVWVRDQNLEVNLRGRTTGELISYAAFQRMKERGLVIDDATVERINTALLALHVVKEEPTEVKPPKPKVVGPIECINKIDAYLDEVLVGNITASRVPNFCETKKDVQIISEFVKRKAAQLEEDRDAHSKDSYRVLKQAYTAITKSLGAASEKIATERSKTAVKRLKPPSVVAKSVKYLRKFLHIEGIPPERMVGAKKAYVFDTKARKLTVFVATEAGFTFSGTTLKNIDAAKTSEKTVRKPEELFAGVQPSMSALNKIYGLIKAKEGTANGRFNESMIVLCVGGF
ncbi:hypothetical protein FDI24_gp241 [Acidovorax phage ACP17]|uniref:Uncharacterized protein n=1 Tax=Acidovorax phage ACP17 TaxID=2010329 RepID=A0A218M394_9CAUD|nr:hypothetical protein FDI24_gp241 [Acidovorax phage ACP17]ASD50522.1 hypothetical protein [Acidovorax phage ACP17]